jgi:hypothetical protein
VAACSIWIRNFAAIAEQRPAETAACLNACIVQALVIVPEEVRGIEVTANVPPPNAIQRLQYLQQRARTLDRVVLDKQHRSKPLNRGCRLGEHVDFYTFNIHFDRMTGLEKGSGTNSQMARRVLTHFRSPFPSRVAAYMISNSPPQLPNWILPCREGICMRILVGVSSRKVPPGRRDLHVRVSADCDWLRSS